jgi:two-component system, OmpR family, response regulator
MSAPRVVVIEHDDWLLRLLQEGLREGGFVVATASSAADGLAKIRELAPDCILCEASLPERDGYSVAIAVRADGPPTSLIPIALLAAEDDTSARTAAFEAGADALLTRPFRLDEVIAQLNALVQLARRMQERRNSLIDSLSAGPASVENASFRADIEHMPVASLLTLLELERKTGTVSAKSDKRRAKLELADGCIVSGQLDGIAMDVVVILRDTLTWTEGRVSFSAHAATPRPPTAKSIRFLLAEARGNSTAALPSMSSSGLSSARGQAIPPPPGKRKSQMMEAVLAPKPDPSPALTDQPTRRVDVPHASKRPSEPSLVETVNNPATPPVRNPVRASGRSGMMGAVKPSAADGGAKPSEADVKAAADVKSEPKAPPRPPALPPKPRS